MWNVSLTGGVSLRTACSSASRSPEASAITQHYQGFGWVKRQQNPTLYLRGCLKKLSVRARSMANATLSGGRGAWLAPIREYG
ncbi:hypothetical protein [Dolichospermum heterosporum]|uniref:Uncharacterized protein n=1 Tax=Dolichospermum heterosporum TAC447 TaxID=747523 RepID=A0ABY5LZ18_9CYAN|nr:hypothetical protein [Dolichospermum heterosporum]UUO15987.1 hypothetical protein NG743_02715 [Dolichospermum heterosporum TAC447]